MKLPEKFHYTYGLQSREFKANFVNRRNKTVSMLLNSREFRKKLLSLNPELESVNSRKMDWAIADLQEEAYMEFKNPKIRALGITIRKPKLAA